MDSPLLSSQGLLLFVLFVLPGSLLHRQLVFHGSAAEEQQSAIVELTRVLYLSVLLTVPAVLATWWLLNWLDSTDLRAILDRGIPDYVSAHPVRTFAIGATYAIATTSVAIFIGQSQAQTRIPAFVRRRAPRLVKAYRHLVPHATMFDSEVWTAAVSGDHGHWIRGGRCAEDDTQSTIPDSLLRIRLKDGTVYEGLYCMEAITSDSNPSRTLVIHMATRVDLLGSSTLLPDDHVLLNLADAYSVEVRKLPVELGAPGALAVRPGPWSDSKAWQVAIDAGLVERANPSRT